MAALQTRYPTLRPDEQSEALWNDSKSGTSRAELCLGMPFPFARTSAERNTGLLKRSALYRGEGLWIGSCAVHTFFMKFPLDLVYIDRENVVRKVVRDVKAWRMSACASARSVIELPSGTIQRTFTERGDRLELLSGRTLMPSSQQANNRRGD
jgi:uncharacterized membrane protein (UPF0127 family)